MSIPPYMNERLEQYYREMGDTENAELQRKSNEMAERSHELNTISETSWISVPMENILGNPGFEIPHDSSCSVKFSVRLSNLSQARSIDVVTEIKTSNFVRRYLTTDESMIHYLGYLVSQLSEDRVSIIENIKANPSNFQIFVDYTWNKNLPTIRIYRIV